MIDKHAFTDAELKEIGRIQKGWSDLVNGIDGKSLEGSDLIGLVLATPATPERIERLRRLLGEELEVLEARQRLD